MVVVNQTAQVVLLAKEIHPGLGTATLWGLLVAYAFFGGVPVVMMVRMPRPLKPPASDSGPEFEKHLLELEPPSRDESQGPHSHRYAPSTAVGSRTALKLLDEDATRIVKQMATTVFLTTAVSQSGRLDVLLVLMTQSRMIWRIAHLYYQRPSLRELLHLYSNVAATAFVVGELDDMELHQMIQPLAAGSLGAVAGAIPGLQVMTNIVVNSLLSGSANAFLTLRVGMIARGYCGSLVCAAAGEIPSIGHGRIGPAPLGHRQGERFARPGCDLARAQEQAASTLAVAKGEPNRFDVADRPCILNGSHLPERIRRLDSWHARRGPDRVGRHPPGSRGGKRGLARPSQYQDNFTKSALGSESGT